MGNLWTELRRRNVFRVAGVYAVAGWLLAQIAATLENGIGLPSWFDGFIIATLLIGFPVALILAWAFELTPEGVKLTANVPEGESIAPKTGRKLDYAILAGVALVAALFVADRLTPEKPAAVRSGAVARADGDAKPPAALDKPAEAKAPPPAASIAVLPFADLSQEGDQAYFSDGVAEEILNVLARIEGLKVASRTSSFQFRGTARGIPSIANELGVRHILEGSVRKSGDAIRVTAQLIDAGTDAHLWSQTFDRPLTTDNVFAIQDEIAKAIVENLPESLRGAAPAPAPRKADTENLDAYELYLKAWSLFVARGRENLVAATEALNQAIKIDPEFARAHELLSAVYAISRNWGISDRDYDALALAEAEAALKLNPELAQPYATRGFVGKTLMLTDASFSWENTLGDLEEAVRRDPLNPTIRFWRGLHYTDLGFFDRAVADMSECFRLDPAYQNCRRFTALAHLHAGRDDEAFALFEAGLAEGFSNANLPFAAAYAQRGQRAAALMLLNLSLVDAPTVVDPVFRAMTGQPVAEEERAAALAALVDLGRTSGVDTQTAVYFLKDWAAIGSDPYPLRGPDHQWFRHDPEWLKSSERKAFIRRLKLPEYWRKHGFPPQCKPVGKEDFECK